MDGAGDDDVVGRRGDRLPSSEDIRSMVDAAFAPGAAGAGSGSPSVASPQSEIERSVDDSDPSPQPELSGLGGLGESEAVGSASGGLSASMDGPAAEFATPQKRSSDLVTISDDGGNAAGDSVSTPRTRNTVEETESVSDLCPKWSEVLSSPKKDSFSPSRDMNKSGSMHGLGLIAAVDRAKKVSRCGKRCANLLADVAVLYDAFAQSILTSCKVLGVANEGATAVFAPPVSGVITELRRSLISFAKQTQGLSICIKGSVARPLHGSASAMADTVPSIFNRYALTRAKCLNARQSAARMRQKYLKALRESEAVIRDLQKSRLGVDSPESANAPARQNGNGSELAPETGSSPVIASQSNQMLSDSDGAPAAPSSSNKKAKSKAGWDDMKKKFAKQGPNQKSDKVVRALDDVQLFEANYIALVEEENLAVSRAQTMEAMALEALQKLEEERLQFFIETMNRALQAESGALDNMMLNLRRGSDDESIASTLSAASSNASSQPIPQNPSALFIKRKNSSMHQNEEGSYVNNALSLNLPEEVGRWRDTRKRNLAAEATRVQAVKVFSKFYQEISSAALLFSSGLQSRLANDGYAEKGKPKTPETLSSAINDFSSKTKPVESLAAALNECEGERALLCLTQVIQSLVECSKSASQLGTTMRKDGKKLLDKFASCEKEYRIDSERDDTRWRHCCDSARELNKARSRLEQSRSELVKAQQRLTSAEEDSGGNSDTTMLRKNPTMTKALGNMFSMLPEEAMTKMLAPDQRLVIVKRNLKEATAKEAKDAQAYEAAQTTKENAIASYTQTLQSANAQCNIKAESLWSAVSVGVDVMVSCFQHFRESRYDSVGPAATWLQHNGKGVVRDMSQWTERVQGIMTRQSEKDGEGLRGPGRTRSKQGNAGTDGFCLQAYLEDSKNVYTLVNLVTGEAEGDESVSSALDAPDLCSSVGVAKALASGEESPYDESEPADKEVAVPEKTGSLPTITPLRQPSENTQELMGIAAALKDNDDRRTTGEQVADGEMTKTAKPESTAAVASSKSADAELFLAHFWDGNETEGDSSSPPTVIDSFSCAWWPKEGESTSLYGLQSPLLHGRLFVTSSAMYFIGWGDKKIVLKWEDVTAVAKATNMMGALDNSLRVTFDSGEVESSYFFGSFAFRDDAFALIEQLSTVARSLRDIKGDKPSARKDAPPDQVLKKMEVVLKKKIKNVSVKKYYENCWSEGNRTDADPFYGPFLIEKKSHDVKVEDWEFDEGEGFENKWSGEKFPQKRVVKFKFTRSTHLYIGPPIAGVTQTQFCSVDGDDTCIVEMTVEMDGIPYADVFAVEVRWVARRVGNKDLLIEVGVLVDFKKSSMFASKIRSGTIEETKPVHVALFDAVKSACAAGPEEEEGDEEEELEEEFEERETLESKNMLGVILSQISSFVSSVKTHSIQSKLKQLGFTAAPESVSQQLPVMLAVVFCFVCLRHFMMPVSDLQHLHDRMDHLNTEMAEVKDLLKEMLVIMKTNN